MEGSIRSFRCPTCRRLIREEILARRNGRCYCGAERKGEVWTVPAASPVYALREYSQLSDAEKRMVLANQAFRSSPEGTLYEFRDGLLVFSLRKTPLKSVLGKPAVNSHGVRFGNGRVVHEATMRAGHLASHCGTGRGPARAAAGAVTCKRCLAKLAHP